MGSQHPSPNVKKMCDFEPQIRPEIITSRDAENTCFKGSRTSCDVISFGIFWPNVGRKRSHHVMDASFGKQKRVRVSFSVARVILAAMVFGSRRILDLYARAT